MCVQVVEKNYKTSPRWCLWRGSGGQWRGRGHNGRQLSLQIFGCQAFHVINTGKESVHGSGMGLNWLENQGWYTSSLPPLLTQYLMLASHVTCFPCFCICTGFYSQDNWPLPWGPLWESILHCTFRKVANGGVLPEVLLCKNKILSSTGLLIDKKEKKQTVYAKDNSILESQLCYRRC